MNTPNHSGPVLNIRSQTGYPTIIELAQDGPKPVARAFVNTEAFESEQAAVGYLLTHPQADQLVVKAASEEERARTLRLYVDLGGH